eukprot:8008203-Lingulodinium_polyedra.AAC.1
MDFILQQSSRSMESLPSDLATRSCTWSMAMPITFCITLTCGGFSHSPDVLAAQLHPLALHDAPADRSQFPGP